MNYCNRDIIIIIKIDLELSYDMWGGCVEEKNILERYAMDVHRRTHDYDDLIQTFLSMLSDQGLLDNLFDHHNNNSNDDANDNDNDGDFRRLLMNEYDEYANLNEIKMMMFDFRPININIVFLFLFSIRLSSIVDIC